MAKHYEPEELKTRYGTSSDGNFAVMGTIGTPHPFCIGPKHVAIAADRFNGRLGLEAIEQAEREGYGCQMRFADGSWCPLTCAEHQTALLVLCKSEMKGADGMIAHELHDYLLRCKPLCEEDGYAGFAFKKGF